MEPMEDIKAIRVPMEKTLEALKEFDPEKATRTNWEELIARTDKHLSAFHHQVKQVKGLSDRAAKQLSELPEMKELFDFDRALTDQIAALKAKVDPRQHEAWMAPLQEQLFSALKTFNLGFHGMHKAERLGERVVESQKSKES